MLVDQPPNLEAVNGGVEERFVNERGEEASRIRVAIDEDLDSPPEQFQPKEPPVAPPNGAADRRVRIDALPPPRRALPATANRPGVPPECVRCAAYLENAEKAFALVQKANDVNRQYQEDQRKLGELERTLEDRLQHISLLTNQLKEAERKEAEHHQRTIESQTRIETLQEHLSQAREEATENKAAAARSKASEEALARTTTHMQALETKVKEMAGRAISSGKALQKFLALVNSKEMRDLSTVGDNPTDAQRRQRAEIRQHPVRTSRRIAHAPPSAQPPLGDEVEDMPEEIAEPPPPKRRTRSSTSSVVRIKKTPEPRSPSKRAAAVAPEAKKEAEKAEDPKPAGRKREERPKDEEPKQTEAKPAAEEEPKEAPKEPKQSTSKSTANVRLRRGTLAVPSDEQEPKAASSTPKPKTPSAAAAQPKRAQLIEVENAPAFPTKRAVRGGRQETLRQPPPTPLKPNDARSRAKTAGASLNFIIDILGHLTQRGQKQPKEKAVADAAKRFDDQLARWAGGDAKLPSVQELVELLVQFIREQNVGDLWGQVRPQAQQNDPIMAATERSFFDFITAINQKGERWPGIFGALIDKLTIEYYNSKPSAVAQKCRDFRVLALALSLFEKEANEEDLKKRTDNVRLLVDTMLGQEDAQAAVRILTFLYTTHRRFLVDRVLAADDPIAPQRRQLIR
ncbi:hypothetical protein M3Y99_00512100 [Aphelenchoides fujianensis]|nr:hypothetical protein M3Y99_00512100 [Aphelenchoides fujianensis]